MRIESILLIRNKILHINVYSKCKKSYLFFQLGEIRKNLQNSMLYLTIQFMVLKNNPRIIIYHFIINLNLFIQLGSQCPTNSRILGMSVNFEFYSNIAD